MDYVETVDLLKVRHGKKGNMIFCEEMDAYFYWKNYSLNAPTVEYAKYFPTGNGSETRWVSTKTSGENLLINGNFDEALENMGSVTSLISGQYMAENFSYLKSGSMVHDYLRSSDTPNERSKYSMAITTTTLDNSIGASDFCMFSTYVEGSDYIKYHNNQLLCLSTYVKSGVVGEYTISFSNKLGDRRYIRKINIESVDTWEKKWFFIMTDDSGTWESGEEFGLRANIVLDCGTDYQNENEDQWISGTYFSTEGQVNFSATTGKTFLISQMKLESGMSPTEFIPDSYGENLRKCNRLFRTSYPKGVAIGTVTFSGCYYDPPIRNHALEISSGQFKEPMRKAPSITAYNPTLLNTVGCQNNGNKSLTFNNVSDKGWYYGSISGGSLSFAVAYHRVDNCRF